MNESCSVADDGTRTCFVQIAGDGDDASTASWVRGLRRDATLVVFTVVATCLAVMAYNYYLHLQIKAIEKRRREKEEMREKDGDGDGSIVNSSNNCGSSVGSGKQPGKPASAGNTARPISPESFAASLIHIEGNEASGNFLSAIFRQMWHHTNVAVSNTIKETLQPTLKDLKVPLHVVKMSLGKVPIRTTNMFIHRVESDVFLDGRKTKRAMIQMDFDVDWDGECDVLLQATMTKSLKFGFGVQSIKLSGRMHILLGPLTTELPVISAVQYGFTNPPEIQLNFCGLAGNITSLGVIRSTLISTIDDLLADMLVLPMRMHMPIDLGSYDYLDTYKPPVGVVRIAAVSGRGFQILHGLLLRDIPDVYCRISLGSRKHVRAQFRTTTKYDDLDPSWEDEHYDFVLYDMDQKVYVDVYDEDKGPLDPDDELGKAEISVRDLFRNDGRVELELEREGQRTRIYITIKGELLHLSEQVQSLTSPEYSGSKELCGLATIIVTKAFDIPIPKGDAATYVKIVYGEGSDHEKTFYTGVVADYPGLDASNPMYDSAFHVPITPDMLKDAPARNSLNSLRGSARNFIRTGSTDLVEKNNITFTLVDGVGANGSAAHGELGKMVVTHESLLGAIRHTITETRPIGNGGAKLEFRVILSGVQSDTEQLKWSASEKETPSRSQDAKYRSMYGMTANNKTNIRITVLRGRGFKIKKHRIKDDVPDVYCTVCLNHRGPRRGSLSQHQSSPWRTPTIKDDTMPSWMDSRDFPGVNVLENYLRVDAYSQCKTKDQFLGSADFSLETLLRKRVLEVELSDGSTLTSSFVTLQCVPMAATEPAGAAAAGVGNGVANRDGHSTTNGEIDDDQGEDGDVVAPLKSISAPSSSHHAHIYDGDDNSISSMNSSSSTRSLSRRMPKIGKGISKRIGKRMSRMKSKKTEE